MNIMNVLRTGMDMFISRIHVWVCYIKRHWPLYEFKLKRVHAFKTRWCYLHTKCHIPDISKLISYTYVVISHLQKITLTCTKKNII